MPRKIISLNDSNWRFGSVAQRPFGDANDLADVSDWLPAQVPGDVRLDLLRAGKISDPFYADNNESSQWIDSRDWWYEREIGKELELELELESDERAFLIFDGIDYQSAVFWNDQQFNRQVGMFSQQIIEIPKSKIKNQKSKISIRLWGSDALPKLERTLAQRLWGLLIKPLFSLPYNEPFPDRYATVKCQMQFGWDFAPRLRTCGIWDDARIVITRSVFIEDAQIKCEVKSKKAKEANVSVMLSLDSDCAQNVRVALNVRHKSPNASAQTFEFDLSLKQGKQTHEINFDLSNPQLWNPWDRGEPNLYEAEIVIHPPLSKTGEGWGGGGLDSLTTTFGIRSFKLAHVPGIPPRSEPWTFVVNGEHEFLRGANWVPMDAIPAQLTREDYAARLNQVRDANINFLRVWGGGLREKQAFYDLCDEMGILVWQEFPFAGAVLDRFPTSREFLNLVREECGAIVRELRNHPSIVVWCGGNEFNTRGNQAIVKTLRQVCKTEDGTRPFKPASPYKNESHNWSVWHRFANLRDYRDDTSPFLSEFGLQSMPNLESLKKFLPDEALQSPHPLWEYHHAELKKLGRYAQPASVEYRVPSSELAHTTQHSAQPMTTEKFVQATQCAQAFGLQIGIEHMRRRKGEAVGVAIWQFNDAWPAISWSVVDYYGTPKRAYDEIKKIYAPVFASFDYPLRVRHAGDTVRGDLYLINDLRESIQNADVIAHLNGEQIYNRRIDIEPDSVARIDVLEVRLGDAENILRLTITHDSQVLCDHDYDLNFCDIGEINPIGALLVNLAKKIMK
jgi:beta-mannosidase